MNVLDKWDRKVIPAWCCITAKGSLETPMHNRIHIPHDAYRSLDIFWDGFWCRASYYTWDYGDVYRYCGRQLPTRGDQWTKEHYLPAIELEIQIVKLASRGMDFEELEKIVKRPRMEIAAIMNEHGYNGLACAIHRGNVTELLGQWPEWKPEEATSCH